MARAFVLGLPGIRLQLPPPPRLSQLPVQFDANTAPGFVGSTASELTVSSRSPVLASRQVTPAFSVSEIPRSEPTIAAEGPRLAIVRALPPKLPFWTIVIVSPPSELRKKLPLSTTSRRPGT